MGQYANPERQSGKPVSLMTDAGQFADVHILFRDNLLSLTYKGIDIFKSVPVPVTPYAGRFVFGARTGGAFEFAWIDNLGIETFPPSTTPLVTGFSSTPVGFTLAITDGTTQLNASSLKLTLDANAITPIVTKNGTATTISYSAATPFVSGSVHPLVVTYADSGGTTKTNTFNLTIPIYATVPESYAVDATKVDKTKPGFTLQVYQTDIADGTQPNTQAWTEDQLAGLHGANIATPSSVPVLPTPRRPRSIMTPPLTPAPTAIFLPTDGCPASLEPVAAPTTTHWKH